MYEYPDICLMAEENPGKPQLIRDVRSVISSNGIPYLQMTSVGSQSMTGREKEGKKERIRDWTIYAINDWSYLNMFFIDFTVCLQHRCRWSAFMCQWLVILWCTVISILVNVSVHIRVIVFVVFLWNTFGGSLVNYSIFLWNVKRIIYKIASYVRFI